MKNISWIAIVVAAFLLNACTPTIEQKTVTTTSGTNATEPSGKPGQKNEPEKPLAESLSQLPAPLKHAGYELYGLGNSKKLNYKITQKQNDQPESSSDGSVQVKSMKMTGSDAEFIVNQTGVQGMDGDSTVILKADGIYSSKTPLGEFKPPSKELTGTAKSGETWTVASSMAMTEGKNLALNVTMSILPEEKVTVPAGTYQCTVVKLIGSRTYDGQKLSVTATAWYAKGVGMVKQVSDGSAGKVKATSTLVLTKME